MPEHNPGQLGGTMRLGRRRTVFSKEHESITSKLFPVLMEYLTRVLSQLLMTLRGQFVPIWFLQGDKQVI